MLLWLWLWRRLAASAPIWPLAWKLPHAKGVAPLKKLKVHVPHSASNLGDRVGVGVERTWCLVTTAWQEDFTPHQASTDTTQVGVGRHFLTALLVASVNTMEGRRPLCHWLIMKVPLSHLAFGDPSPERGCSTREEAKGASLWLGLGGSQTPCRVFPDTTLCVWGGGPHFHRLGIIKFPFPRWSAMIPLREWEGRVPAYNQVSMESPSPLSLCCHGEGTTAFHCMVLVWGRTVVV